MSKEKVLVIAIDYETGGWLLDDVTCELSELVIACGGEIVDKATCRIYRPTAAYFIGEGKAKELALMAKSSGAVTAVFSHDLKGSQQRNLEEILKIKTIDRTQLILDIFARRATSQEGKMQVELAQLEYNLPRLVGKGIELSRLGGGIGTRGPGETKLEIDRRRIGERITKLKKELNDVAADRAVKRKKRKDQGIPLVSLVGYTNAGKSTLLNALTEANQLTVDGLFTTLDPLSRQYTLPNHQKIILSDTVGFMHDLPHHLIEAFKATLEEVTEADILLHILDVSHPQYQNLYTSVLKVLKDLKADEKPMITVLNKIDKLDDPSRLDELNLSVKNPVAISAKTGQQLPLLLKKIAGQLAASFQTVDVVIPIHRMDLVHLAHKEGQVFSVEYQSDTIHLKAALPMKLAGLFRKNHKA